MSEFLSFHPTFDIPTLPKFASSLDDVVAVSWVVSSLPEFVPKFVYIFPAVDASMLREFVSPL